jgi:hypothetical protein
MWRRAGSAGPQRRAGLSALPAGNNALSGIAARSGPSTCWPWGRRWVARSQNSQVQRLGVQAVRTSTSPRAPGAGPGINDVRHR